MQKSQINTFIEVTKGEISVQGTTTSHFVHVSYQGANCRSIFLKRIAREWAEPFQCWGKSDWTPSEFLPSVINITFTEASLQSVGNFTAQTGGKSQKCRKAVVGILKCIFLIQ